MLIILYTVSANILVLNDQKYLFISFPDAEQGLNKAFPQCLANLKLQHKNVSSSPSIQTH